MPRANPSHYLGVRLSLSTENHIVLPHHDFVSRLILAPPGKFSRKGSLILSKPRILAAFLSVVGDPISVLQTQLGVAYFITRFATTMAHHCDSPRDVLLVVNLANEIIRPLQTHHTVLHYLYL